MWVQRIISLFLYLFERVNSSQPDATAATPAEATGETATRCAYSFGKEIIICLYIDRQIDYNELTAPCFSRFHSRGEIRIFFALPKTPG